MTQVDSTKAFAFRRRIAIGVVHRKGKIVGLAKFGLLKALVLGLLLPPAVAATIVSTMGVSAGVLPPPGTCLIESTNVAPYVPKGDRSHAVSIECTGTMPYAVSLDADTATGTVITNSQETGHFTATWSYAPPGGDIQLFGWSRTGGSGDKVLESWPTRPIPIVHDWLTAATPTAPFADFAKITAIVRY